jgi:hypothetical protein
MEGRPWLLKRRGGASREAVGLCFTAQPEVDEGEQGPVVWERRGALGRLAEEWGGGLSGLGQPAGQG